MIINRKQILIADELMDLVPKLKQEFLDYHIDYYTTYKKAISYSAANPLTILNDDEKKVWKVEGLRYVCQTHNTEINLFLDPEISNRFPTATSLTKKYLNVIGCSGYSSLDPGGKIEPHVDIENPTHNTIRIHIPLIIPDGDVMLDAEGIKTKWTDLFAFDNGSIHSAYNKTNERRLIYIIDIERSFLGLPKWGSKTITI